jgi:hypothetical protein
MGTVGQLKAVSGNREEPRLGERTPPRRKGGPVHVSEMESEVDSETLSEERRR